MYGHVKTLVSSSILLELCDCGPYDFVESQSLSCDQLHHGTHADTTVQADAELKGIREAGGDATLFQVPETLSEDVLQKNDAVLNDPTELEAFDAVLFGIPTRYGNFPAQFKTFWDKTGKQWQQVRYLSCTMCYHIILTTSRAPSGASTPACSSARARRVAARSRPRSQPCLRWRTTASSTCPYKTAFAQLSNLEEIHGGSPWGAGTFSGGDGSRQPTALELSIATEQGKAFYAAVAKAHP
jgi:NAD(P)H dehydrogenase (quinone)